MFSIVYITTGSMEEAKLIAGRLVKEKLAASVNMFPVTWPWDKIHSRLQSMNDSNHHYKILMSFNIPFIFRC